MKLGRSPRRSSKYVHIHGGFGGAKCAHGNNDTHKSMVVESTRKRCCPDAPIGSGQYTNVLPVRSIAGRTPHKCASQGLRWHLQALTAGPVHQSPYATASQAATDRPQYRASFREAYRDTVLGELADRKMAGRDQALPSLTAMAILEFHGQSLRRAGA
jgi:hypothetical protein